MTSIRLIKPIKQITFLILLMLIFGICKVEAVTGVEAFAATKALEDVVNTGLTKVDRIFDKQQHQLLRTGSALISLARHEFGAALGDANIVLTQKQVQIFGDINKLKSEMDSMIKGTLTDLNSLEVNLENAITRIPFAEDNPAPISYDLPVLTVKQNGIYVVPIKGVKLEHEDNYIIINGKKFNNKTTKLPAEVAFKVNLSEGDVFPQGVNTMEIHLFKSRWFRSPEEFTYKVSYDVTPYEIADIEIYYETIGKTRKERNKELTFQVTPGGCNTKEASRSLTPDSGYLFDRERATISKVHSAEGSSSCHYDRSVSNTGALQFRAKGSCSCNMGIVKGCSKTECLAKWVEYAVEDVITPGMISYKLKYDSQTVIELPPTTNKYIKVKMKFYNGKEIVIQDSDFNQYFLSFKYDNARKQAAIAFSPSITK